MRLIDADALKENMGEQPLNWNNSPEEIQEMFDWNNFTQLIDEAPTIEAEQVRHGHWILIKPADIDHNITVECSVCGAGDTHAEGVKVPYCWKCGTKMDEVSE